MPGDAALVREGPVYDESRGVGAGVCPVVYGVGEHLGPPSLFE